MYKENLLFILLVFILYSMDLSIVDRSTKLVKAVFIAVLFLVLYQVIVGAEGFFFEVTPWKKTCAQNRGMRCPQCCAAGFNGQNICFEYTGDVERMNMQQAGCACPKRAFPKNNPNDYYSLGDATPCNIPNTNATCGSTEGFGYLRGDHMELGAVAPCNAPNANVPCTSTEGFGYLRGDHMELGAVAPCNAPNANVPCATEGYCSSGCGV